MKTKNMFKRKKINPDDYANRYTGELLSSEQPHVTSVMIKNNDVVIVSSLEFICIDSVALRYIQTLCSKADMEKIHRMSNMVSGIFNLIHTTRGVPHSPKTLRLELDYDESEFCRFMKRLHSKSIINYMSGCMKGKKCRWIMLNPTFARKQKSFHKDCLNVFDDLSDPPAVRSMTNIREALKVA